MTDRLGLVGVSPCAGLAGSAGLARDRALLAVRRMQAALGHRGPDGDGLLVVDDPAGQAPPIVLGHTRLAVLDTTEGAAQPMSLGADDDRDGSLHLAYNGEVVNFRELRERLDEPVRSDGDSEVVLRALRRWGPEAVRHMRGMFAWALVDARARRLWLCRDRLGVKPLFVARPPGGGLLFASELRALLAAGPELVPSEVSSVALESFLAQGAVYDDGAFVSGVCSVAPGTWQELDWEGREVRCERYWDVPRPLAADGFRSRDAFVSSLGVELRHTVRLNMESDVPIGVFLSGGVDSTAVATVATEACEGEIHTVTVGFDQPDADESEEAAEIARQLGTRHTTLRLTGEDVLANLDDALAALDQPTVDAFNTFFVSGAARAAGLTVALSGVGGDELFAGYASFEDVPRALAWRGRLGWAGAACALAARAAARRGGRRLAKAAELFSREASPYRVYLLRRELFLPAERRSLHGTPPGVDAATGLPLAVIADADRAVAGLDAVDQVSRFEMGSYMRHMLLRDADVASMAHGLEIRVPLLDHVLVEMVAGSPPEWRRPGAPSKALLVDAAGPRFPHDAARRPKRGFALPWAAWLRGPLRERARSAAANHGAWARLGLQPDAPERIVAAFLDGDRRIAALQVLAFIVLEHQAARLGLRRAG